MAKKKMWVTYDKAKRELGFSPAPAQQALSRAVDDPETSGEILAAARRHLTEPAS